MEVLQHVKHSTLYSICPVCDSEYPAGKELCPACSIQWNVGENLLGSLPGEPCGYESHAKMILEYLQDSKKAWNKRNAKNRPQKTGGVHMRDGKRNNFGVWEAA